MANEAYFSVADSIIFALSLAASLGTGIYFAVKDRKDTSTDTYFKGNGKMSPVPIGLSLAVSFVSALTIMGYPVEVYLYGTVWFWLLTCFPLVVLTTSNYFIPMYYELKLNCLYEYLELRFNKTVRLIGSTFALLYLILYLSAAVYYPALSLSTVTPLSVNWAIAITILVCGVYTVIGGFKSVVWTDTFQSMVMLIGCVALVVNLAMEHEFSQVLKIIENGNRSTWKNFSLNPFIRCTPWSIFLLGYLDWLLIMTTSQPYVQRFISCASASKAKMALFVSVFPQMIITLLSVIMGVYLYAHYATCDPFKNGEIISHDQILPFAVVKNTRNLPGLAGLFVATVYSCTFSTISSGLNSMIVIIMEDFHSLKWKFKDEEKKLKLSKLCGVCITILLLVLSYFTTLLDSTFVQISFTIPSAFGSSLFCIFVLGMFVPWANPTGTLIGAFCGFVVSLWLAIGSLVTGSRSQELPVSTENCTMRPIQSTFNESSIAWNTTSTIITEEDPGISPFEISFGYFRLIAMVISLPIGIIASFITGPEDPKKANPRLFVPLLSSKLFPENLVKFMRFGVPVELHREKKEELQNLKMDN